MNEPESFVVGGMKYSSGQLTVPTSGHYFVYAHFVFSKKGRLDVQVNGKIIINNQGRTAGLNLSGDAVAAFYLNAGDKISVLVHAVSSVEFYCDISNCYFGAFLID